MQYFDEVSPDVLAEAVVIASYALREQVTASDVESYYAAIGDSFLATMFLGLAMHVHHIQQ